MEIVAWAVIIALALATRLVDLGARPLSDTEAAQALVSWQLYQGLQTTGRDYSPLLTTAGLIAFALWGATEFTARLASAIAGAFLVLLPMGLRRPLGRIGALCAGVLICLSPSALYLSRTTNGDIFVVAGAALWFIGITRVANGADGRHHLGAITMVVGLALVVVSSPLAGSMILLLLTFGGALWVTHCWKRVVWLHEMIADLTARRGVLIAALIAVLVIANGLFVNQDGLPTMVDQIEMWLRGFAPATGSATPASHGMSPVYPALWLLGLYDPLTLLAGLFGLRMVLARRRSLDLWLAWWFCGGVLLDVLRPGRSVGEMLLTMWPAALLAGLAIGKFVETVWKQGDWKREGVVVASCLTVFTFAYITFMMYASNYGVIWQPLAAIGMLVVLIVAFWQWHDSASTVRGVMLAMTGTLFLFHVAGAVRLNYTPIADASQPLVRASAGEGLRDLVTVLQFASVRKANDPYLVEILAGRDVGPAVEWQLRAFPNVSWVRKVEQLPVEGASSSTASRFPEVVLAPEGALLTDEPYAGQDFVVRNYGQPTSMPATAFIRWYLLREPQPQQPEKVVLWVKQPSAANTSEK